MANKYKTESAFKSALDAKLRSISIQKSIPLQTLQLKLVIERFLMRLQNDETSSWFLKGGYALALRFPQQSRTTKDVDLNWVVNNESSKKSNKDYVRNRILESIKEKQDDYFDYRITDTVAPIQNAPGGGFSFLCEVYLLQKVYARFPVDIGLGDAKTDSFDVLKGGDYLDFAGLKPITIQAVTMAQHFAEKVHAYTFPWKDRQNTRTKDLVDMVLFIERKMLDLLQVKNQIIQTFLSRNTHPVPEQLPEPPQFWRQDFSLLAFEAGLVTTQLSEAYQTLNGFWSLLHFE